MKSIKDKSVWSQCLWYLLHILAEQVSNKSVKNEKVTYNLIINLDKVLPCPKCIKHFKKYLKKHKLEKSTDLKKWIFDYHNDVNKMLKKTALKYEQLDKLFYVDDTILPINHQYIIKLLQIFNDYSKENNNLTEFNKFFKLLRKVFPCQVCGDKLKESKKLSFKKQIKIIEKCTHYDKKIINKQIYKASF